MGTTGNKDAAEQRPQPTTFRFKNIGPVKDAELELGNLTIICGRNNTGKTYIVYTLYGFLKMWDDWPYAYDLMLDHEQTDFPDMDNIAKELNRTGEAILRVDRNTLQSQRQNFTQAVASAFSRQALPRVFSSQHDDFQKSSIEVSLGQEFEIGDYSGTGEILKRGPLSIRQDASDFIFKGADDQMKISDLASFLSDSYFIYLLRGNFPEPFILSAERFGISLFYRELDFTKNRLVDLLQKMDDDKHRDRFLPFVFLDQATSRYAMPIKDNIDYTRSIPDLRGKKSEIYHDKLFDDIKGMMGGYYGNSGNDIRFISKARGKGRSFNIPLHLASSSARGLSDFYFFLRHEANTNHLLIVDEPESHLDTANQILLARLLARFVRAGLKVLITTHSDYLIKEINNLVMLNSSFAEKESVVKKLEYQSDDALEPESIRAYVAENNGLTRCDVDEFGIDMPVFDRTIDEINKVANELASRLSDDSEG